MEEKELLEKANVLLISDVEEDYDGLIEYGFQNVDYFKSVIRAERYFEKEEENLKKYHLVLLGHQVMERNMLKPLESKIDKLEYLNKILVMRIKRWKYPECTEFAADFGLNRIKEYSYRALIYSIVSYAKQKNILETARITKQVFPKIEDYVNPNKLPLPKKKQEVKILFLESKSAIAEATPKMMKTLGLNITIKEDNKTEEEKTTYNLGEYDIIIAQDSSFSKLKFLNIESTEQCKDTGRRLTLLLTYQNNSIAQFNEDGIYNSVGFGDKVTLYYNFGGELAKTLKSGIKEYQILRREDVKKYGIEETSNFFNSWFTTMQTSMEEAVHIYNETLKELNLPPLEDFDLKTAEEYDKEYENVERQEKERIENVLAPIQAFDTLQEKVEYYLRYEEQNLVPKNLEGLRVTETTKGALIEMLIQGEVYGALLLPHKRRISKLRIFEIKTRNSKGKLIEDFEKVGVYTKRYENVEGVPKWLNEIQEKTFNGICKRVNCILTPINEKAALEVEKAICLVRQQK